MALATEVTGTGTLVSYDPGELRVYFVQSAASGRRRFTESTITTVREWYALTEAAAQAWADAERAAGESRRIDRVSWVGGGEYKAIQTVVTKTLTSAAEPSDE